MKLIQQGLAGIEQQASFDVVVVGAGGAGLSAALFAALQGAKVLVVERTNRVGGTTALSAGTTWVPGTQHAAKVNPGDTLEQARVYLDAAVGERSDANLRQAFLDHGREAVDLLEQHSAVQYRPYPKHPDYISDLPGSTLSGRALEPLPFDGRLLGDLFKVLREPIPEFTVLGGMMVDRTDINHLLALTQNWTSFKHACKILLRHAKDRLSYPRGTRLVMGNALVARLLYSLSQQDNVTLALNTSLTPVQGQDGYLLQSGSDTKEILVTSGLILASGGFNRHPERRAQMLPGIPAEWSPGAPGHTGQAHDWAQKLGAQYGQGAMSNAFWAPMSLRRRADGSQAVFPHFVMDRAKPGVLTVNRLGQRFVNESTSYHLFGLAMQKGGEALNLPAFLVADARALKAYGLGMVRPGGKGLEPFLADGYLTEGRTLTELAHKLGLPAGALEKTVTSFNQVAATGVDAEFGRGVTAYQQNLGDPNWAGKNVNLGALETGPYYAVKLVPGDIGAATGFQTDASARVLDVNQKPIPKLYAIGNDMHSIMGGTYPAPGITIGPGLVFAYLAVKSALTNR
jgi:succinate dehydrogenase/fumarate reductase flavoprotein subunit